MSPSACSPSETSQRNCEYPPLTALVRQWLTCMQVCATHLFGPVNQSNTFIVSLTADFTSLSGIGYFTLPYLVHAGAAHVHACEWNPDAVSALQRNLHINKVAHRCTVHQGDNKQVRMNLSTFASKCTFISGMCIMWLLSWTESLEKIFFQLVVVIL